MSDMTVIPSNPIGAEFVGAGAGGTLGGIVGSWLSQGLGGFGNRGGAAVSGIETAQLMEAINNGTMATTKGLCDLGYATAAGNAAITAAVNTNGYEGRLATQQLQNAMEACCCKTNSTIVEQACQTRELINAKAYEALQEKLCDAKAKISSMESNQLTTAAVSASTIALENKMNQQMQTILQHMAMMCGGKPRHLDS